MSFDKLEIIPQRVTVSNISRCRYGEAGERPISWDQRTAGVDEIQTDSGKSLKLFSDGGQGVPKPGWVVLITGGDSDQGYTWTLYGLT